MTARALATARALGEEVVAVSVQFEEERVASLEAEWARWDPGVPLTVLRPRSRSIVKPMLAYLERLGRGSEVLVLIPDVEPKKWRHQLLQNQRGIILANALRRHSDAIVARVPFRLERA
jgi:hypothetical protein